VNTLTSVTGHGFGNHYSKARQHDSLHIAPVYDRVAEYMPTLIERRYNDQSPSNIFGTTSIESLADPIAASD